MSLFGASLARSEDDRFLTGTGRYVSALELPGALHVAFVRSPTAHGLLRSVDVTAARDAPGVVLAVTGNDIAISVPARGSAPACMSRPLLACNRVRFVGEAVAAVVADTAAHAADAAERVIVDCVPLPVVVDPLDALRDEILLFPEAGTNTMVRIVHDRADPAVDVLAGAEVVVSCRLVVPRIAPAPLEARAAAAAWDGERLTFHAACQGAGSARDALASLLGLPPLKVRVLIGDVGGSFGAKSGLRAEELVIGWLAMRVDRPVRWSESRTENLTAMSHGRAQSARVSAGATRDGRITGLRVEVVQDGGAYPDVAVFLPEYTKTMATGAYAIPALDWSATVVATNSCPVGAFRGAGRPEAAFFVERIVDVLGRRLAMDPAELRRRNFVGRDSFPHTSPAGACYDSGAYEVALQHALTAAGYTELRAAQQARREACDPVLMGIGMASYVEITNPGGSEDPGLMTLQKDGTIVVTTASTSFGQGLETAYRQLAADRLGLDPADITILGGDSDLIVGPTTGGSKSLQTAGVVIDRCAVRMIAAVRGDAADLLEAAPEDTIFTGGRFHVTGSPSRWVGWHDVAQRRKEPLTISETHRFGSTFPFGTHVCVVEIDAETGAVRLTKVVAVDDCGHVLNPALVCGQIHGGLGHGFAFGLLEEVAYDADGNPLTANFADYPAISAAELPSFEVLAMETPTPANELGVKGAGESGAIGSTAAFANAVADALSPFGVVDVRLPATPERVWAAIHKRALHT